MVRESAHPSGIDAFRPDPRPGIPKQLQASVRLWLVAVAAGLFETALVVVDATDQFDTWAYAWTLVFVVGAGVGRWLVGVVRGRGELAASGAWLIAAGLVGFLGLAVFFEVAVGLSGHRSGAAGRYVLAALLILAGLGLVGRRLLTARRP